MEILVSYESIHQALTAYANVVEVEVRKKVHTCCFFILYNHMNFYKYVHDTHIFNHGVQIYYTVGYIYFIYSPNSLRDKSPRDDLSELWPNQYLLVSLNDCAKVNKLCADNFTFSSIDFQYKATTI